MAEVSFGEWLKRQRGARGWTQQQLAQEINCSISSLRKMEAEERRPSVQLTEQLAELFNIPQNERKAFLQFTRGNSLAFSGGGTDEGPWRITTPRSNLPASITSFIGRTREQAEIIELITKNRLVTLAGVGGIGKTSVSLQVGQKLLNEYPNGVWLIAFDSISDPSLVPQAIASVFGIREGSSGQPLPELLSFSLRPKTALLIFDNCEHLLDACAQLIKTLLTSCPHLKILATSRETFHMDGEAVYDLPALSLPEQSNPPLETLAEYKSIRLFTERATLALSSFHLTKENVAAIVEICRRVDGIPLAIELAAARVNILNVEEILKQLHDSFSLLANDGRTILLRHQTLQASMDWSWGLLSGPEQIFLRRLSVFAGGWTFKSAQAICEGAALNLVSALVKKSLIMVNRASGHETRYRLHETIRQYAREKLNNSGETRIICLRHLVFFAEMVEEAERNFKGPHQALWYNRLDNELDNLRIALTWFEGIENAEMRLRFAAGLWRYWKNRGHSGEGRGHLQRILEGLPLGPSRQTSACARALTAAGSLAYYEGDFSYSEQSRKEALAIFRNLDDKVGIADCLNGLGNTAISQGSYDSAHVFYEESLTIRKELGDEWGVARLLGNLGLLAYFQADYIQAYLLHLESLILFRELRDDEGVANELVNLGDVARCQRELSTANSFYKESVVITKKLKDQWGLAYAIMGMADVAFEQGEFSTASSLYTECLTIFQKGADYVGLPFALESVAALALVKNQPEKAARIFGAADTLRKSTNSPLPLPNRAFYQKNLSILQHQLDPSIFDMAWGEGQAMMPDEAVAYALEES